MTHLIGATPLLKIPHPKARIFAKWEGTNLTGSAKDRAVTAMLDAANLPPGATVIEATSGNTGISLAALCAVRRLGCIIVMPENMSRERIARMTAYGAQVLLTPAAEGMHGAVKQAQKIAGERSGSLYLDQFSNPANPQAHFAATGPEIWQDTDGEIDCFLAGVGTGGTLSGTARYLKQQNPAIQVIAVEPAPGSSIPGLGAGFIPKNLDLSVIDKWISVTSKDSTDTAKALAQNYGLLVGISSGAAIHAARLLAERAENRGKTIVTILPDTGCRYLSIL